jgi:octaprenyl-diphosphate synthase
MVHTATLLHDDVADQSDTRRGAVTVQKLYSPLASVLLGDFWLARAFQLLMDHDGESFLCFFARATCEMSEGELFQMEKASLRNTTIAEYYQIIIKKTAMLMLSGMVAGAKSAGANREQCSLMERIGLCLGIAFQIRDDILDYSPQLHTGKPSSHDLMEGKLTLPLLTALEHASPSERQEAQAWIRELPNYPQALPKILGFVQNNKGVELAQREVEKKGEEAKTLLLQCPDSAARHHLESMIEYLLGRRS